MSWKWNVWTKSVGKNKIFENMWKSDLWIESCGWVSKPFQLKCRDNISSPENTNASIIPVWHFASLFSCFHDTEWIPYQSSLTVATPLSLFTYILYQNKFSQKFGPVWDQSILFQSNRKYEYGRLSSFSVLGLIRTQSRYFKRSSIYKSDFPFDRNH